MSVGIPNNPLRGKYYKFVASDYCPIPDVETHSYFARNNSDFRAACSLANVQPDKRQARKWQQKRGKAWQAAKQAS